MAGLSEQTIESISRHLLSAERDRRTLRPITETCPEIDIDGAYKIQLGLIPTQGCGWGENRLYRGLMDMGVARWAVDNYA